jgi:hypothetical protein
MAAPNISVEPTGIVSTLEPIFYQYTEFTPNTLNIVCQLQYFVGGVWTNWGGRMRTAPMLEFAGYFQLNASDVFNSLPKGEATDIRQLGDGCCYDGAIGQLPQSIWQYISNWEIRVVAQREYLDVATGFIELDPDETISRITIAHEGSQPKRNQLWNSIIPASQVFAEFVMQQDPNESRSYWLWLTDAIWQKNNSNRDPHYDVNIRESEQFYISTFNGRLDASITQNNYLEYNTFDVSGNLLASRQVTWQGGMSNNYMQTIDVGFRSIKCIWGDNPQGGESLDLTNVAFYVVTNWVSRSNNTGYSPSVQWKFKVDRTCKPKSYQRFLWKNQLGGWDMFSSEGKLTTRRKMKHERFEKRMGMNPHLGSYGSNNWVNTEEEILQIETQAMTKADAMWFSKIGASSFTYLRLDMNSEFNPQVYGTFSTYENWRDSGKCNDYIPIVINSSSIKIINTTKKLQKISFEYQLAARNLYPRN